MAPASAEVKATPSRPSDPKALAIVARGPNGILFVTRWGDATQAVQSAFNRLADTVLNRAGGERSIEDLSRELLRGMLKQWLDEHLPNLVERLVREEIERVARRGR